MMFTKVLVTVVTAAAMAVSAPPATADHATVVCDGNGLVAYGYILSPTPGEHVSIRCEIYVAGVPAGSTPTASGTQFAFTSTPFVAVPGMTFCAVWTAGSESGKVCDLSAAR